MQLSAPALFPEMLVPAAPGELPAEVSAEGEAPADFAALFAGLTAPAPKTPAAATPPAASKAKSPMEDAGLVASLVAVPDVELPPAPPPPAGLPSDSMEGLEKSEGDAGEEALPFTSPHPESATKSGSTPAVPLDPALASQRPAEGPASGERAAARPARAPAVMAGAQPSPVAAMPLTSAIATSPLPPAPAMPFVAPAESPALPAEVSRLAAAGPILEEAERPAKSVVSRRAEGGGQEFAKGTAKFAADAAPVALPSIGAKSAEKKNFLSVDSDDLAKPYSAVGTSVALRESVMTTSAPTAPSPVFAPVSLGPKEGGMDLGAMGSLDPKVTVPAPVERMAHRAVEAVAATIERGASQPAHSVNLKFSVQGADLMVRVALRSDEVQVTFRTESPELRNALAHEWQLVRSRDPEGVLHAVTPVFTAGDSGNATSHGGRDGGGSFAQQQAQAQAQADAHSQRHSSRQPAPAAPASATVAAGASTAPAARPLSNELTGAARLLHTFA